MLLTEYIEFHARSRPDSPMLIQDGEILSFNQSLERARGIAAWLQQRGVGKGDRVAVLGENSIDHILLLLGASYVGAVFVPLNYRLAAAELAEVIEDAHAQLLLVSDQNMQELKSELKSMLADDSIVASELGYVDGFTQSVAPNDSDTVIQMYTSGTTGRAKGVQMSHSNVQALAIPSWMMYVTKVGIGTTDLVVAPLFHIGGLGSVLIPIMAGGAVLIHSQFDPLQLVDDIEQYSVNTMFLVPAMIQATLTIVPDIRDRDFSSLKQVAYGASPISPSLLSEAIDVFGCHFLQLYGMTETTGPVVALLPEDHDRAMNNEPDILQSCGRAVAGVKAKICDSEGNEVELGETGEIVILSDSNTCGYWQRPEETEKAIRDGWIHTGDAGIMDEEGYIYIRDRIKDMVITGGENVYPVEVEKVLAAHPAILEAAVIGVPDEKFGETLLAVCVLNKGEELSADELVEYCRGKIAGYKIPRQLQVLDELPRNPSGKILKTTLREPYWGSQVKQV